MEARHTSLKQLLLGLARERSTEALLKKIATDLAEQPDVALARVWLIKPGDICDVCPQREDCARNVDCLHLAASAGTPRHEGVDWTRLKGEFSRFPIGVRKVGAVGAGEPIRIEDVALDDRWIARPEWAKQAGIRGFGGEPLAYRGEVLGALGVFTRVPFEAEAHEWLQLVADHAAAAIANAQAFEEIERLRRMLELENEYLREEMSRSFGDIVGESLALRRVLEQIALVATTDATVLIEGESGTGKELVAREIHRCSARRDDPLIQVNCASIPRELFESEFFGHVRGAFTGAVTDREGRFTAAQSGTIFLDEVGEIPLELQSKLLRVLQEGTYERVGEAKTRTSDVRVIAATNRDLRREVEEGRFREDLYYRLNVFPILVPPLRERREDIVPLAASFLERSARRLGRSKLMLTSEDEKSLERYPWPGNVRELANVIERSVITSKGRRLQIELPEIGRDKATYNRSKYRREDPSEVLNDLQMREFERENLIAALRKTGWKIAGPGGAAQLLGVPPTTLASRLKKMGIERRV